MVRRTSRRALHPELSLRPSCRRDIYWHFVCLSASSSFTLFLSNNTRYSAPHLPSVASGSQENKPPRSSSPSITQPRGVRWIQFVILFLEFGSSSVSDLFCKAVQYKLWGPSGLLFSGYGREGVLFSRVEKPTNHTHTLSGAIRQITHMHSCLHSCSFTFVIHHSL